MMKSFGTIEVEMNDKIATVWLNRPEVQNAFNLEMLRDLSDCFQKLDESKSIRVILLRGRGKSFCSGADLNWLKDSQHKKYPSQVKEGKALAKCLNTIYASSKPVVAVVHGAVVGGGNGFTSACDIVLAQEDTQFSLPETRIGLAPSTIMPYILLRIPQHYARLLIFTGRRIDGNEALRMGLTDVVTTSGDLQISIDFIVADILKSAPNAMKESKKLINQLYLRTIDKKIIRLTSRSFAQMKMEEECREGVAARLEKRSPKWVV
jgi:methylglutaconyl-CoA hydratase